MPDYKQNKATYNQLEKDTASAVVKLDSLKSAKTDLAGLGDIVDNIFLAVPADRDVPNLITELEATAAKYKMGIPSISIAADAASTAAAAAPVDPATVAAPSNAIPVSFSVAGDFENINKFIASLEKNIRFMNIQSLSVAQGEKDMSLSVQLLVYKRSSSSVSDIAPVASGVSNSAEVTQ